MYYKTYRNPPRCFAVHRRVTRRHLHNAAFGNFTTVSAAIVWFIAFYSLWILILHCLEENNPYNWTLKQKETDDYAIERLESYRSMNAGKLPESLEAIGFNKGYRDNIYYLQLPGDRFFYELEYIRLSDTSYCLNFGGIFWGRGQYLSTVGYWNIYCTRFDSETCDYVIEASEGEEAPSVYLNEYEFPEWLDSIKVPLESIVRSNREQQQYMLRISDHNRSTCGWINNDDTISCINYNCILHTFDAMLWPDIDYFRDISGYTMLGDKVCFIVNETSTHYISIVKPNGKGRLFNVPQNRGCTGGEQYWYLDIDASYGGKVTLKGIRVEE